MRLIDCEPLMEYFEGLARSLANARCFNAADAIQGAAEKLRNAPTIDAEPVRHGQWEKASEYMPIYVCSECKERNLFKNGNNVFSNYCPNCGAKMMGVQNDE